MSINTDCLRERLPAEDLPTLFATDSTPAGLAAWVATLPLVNTSESVPLVFRMLQDVERLRISEATRFELLEVIREPVRVLGHALSKHYLNNTLVLSDAAARVATLAQSMQYHLAGGYKRVVINLLDAPRPPPKKAAEQRQMLAEAMLRAMSNLVGAMLRVTELYLSPPPGLWQELHCLYRLAEREGLARVRLPVPGSPARATIEDTYVRALLLATCSPNKLRQGEIRQVFELTETWAPMVCLVLPRDGSGLFVYDLCKDESPANRAVRGDRDPETVRAVDPTTLVQRLGGLTGQQPHPRDRGEAALHGNLAQHLLQSWSRLSERGSSRKKHEATIEICIGLMATHYYLGDRQEFQHQLRGRIDPNAHPDDTLRPVRQQHEAFTAQTSDISAGGYGINWEGDLPVLLKVGELVGVREPGHEWSIGVVRWVRQIPGRGAQMGLEVLAPSAQPCGTRIERSWDEHAQDFMRTLIVPGLKALNRPATLITPNVSFQPGNRITIMRNGKEAKARLVKLFSTAHSFRQFEFQLDDNDFRPRQAPPAEPELEG